MITNKRTQCHEQWKTWVTEQQKSDLSQKAFCEQNGLSVAKFAYYKSLLNPSQESAKKGKVGFSEIKLSKQVMPTSPFSGEIKIILPSSIQCIFPASIDTRQIKSLMEVLLSC